MTRHRKENEKSKGHNFLFALPTTLTYIVAVEANLTMRFLSVALLALFATSLTHEASADEEEDEFEEEEFEEDCGDCEGQMVKMCLFYGSASGHARSDPIINQECASDHVHTVSDPCWKP